MLFPILGLLCLGLSYIASKRSLEFSKSGKYVLATIVDVEIIDELEFTEYYPVFDYEIENKKYTLTYNESADSWRKKIGDQQLLICSKSDPYIVKVATFWGLFKVPVFFACIGCCIFVIFFWRIWFYNFFTLINS